MKEHFKGNLQVLVKETLISGQASLCLSPVKASLAFHSLVQ